MKIRQVAAMLLLWCGTSMAAPREKTMTPEWVLAYPQFAAFDFISDQNGQFIIGGETLTNSLLIAHTRNGRRLGAATVPYASAMTANRAGQVAVAGWSGIRFGPPVASYTTTLFSQHLRELEWQSTIVPTNDYHVWYNSYFFNGTVRAVVLDEQGRAFVGGNSKTAPTTGATDLFVMRQDALGTPWFADHQTGFDERCAGIVLMQNGDVVTAANQYWSGGPWTYLLQRHTPDGTLLWRSNSPTNLIYLSLIGLASDSMDNIIVAGRQSSYAYGEGYFVEKRNPQGAISWRIFLAQTNTTYPNALAVDEGDNIYVNYQTLYYVRNSTGFFIDVQAQHTAKFNALGEHQWTSTKTNAQRHVGFRGLAVDRGGNIYISDSLGVGLEDRDIETRKLSRDGEEEWVARFDAGADERLVKILADDHGVFVTLQSSRQGYAPPAVVTSYTLRYFDPHRR